MSENVPHAPPPALSGDATCRISNERLFVRITVSLCSRTPSFVRHLSFLLARMEFLPGTRGKSITYSLGQQAFPQFQRRRGAFIFGQRATRWCLTIIPLLVRDADGNYRFCNVRLD